jgi:hypothetical protein
MRQFTAIDMLTVWEQGLNQTRLYRALLFLMATHPELDPNDIAEWSIGQRDQRLLQLRKQLFGSTLVSTCVCPECSERIEWQNNVNDILMDEEELCDSDFDLEIDTYKVRFRLPNSLDIAAVIDIDDIDKAQTDLLKRCVLEFSNKGKERPHAKLPKKVIAALSKRVESLDPQAEIAIDLACPACAHRWDVLFDISSFLWTELNDWAERTLQMIHVLASAYGWTEQEILMLSPVRRQLYLGMLRP